jgi:CubicO group peptidase (beta-lactamase class C family)
VAVGKGGEVVWSKGYGLANLELGAPVTTSTKFRTASIAKPMTAVAVLQLAEAKQLDLDAAVSTVVPEWKNDDVGVTARNLLGHLGGVRHYKAPGESSGTRYYPTLGSTLSLFAEDALVQKPGTKYQYTTFGYTLLGLLVESKSPLGYRGYMQESVWDKASMKDTTVDDHWRIIPGRAQGYSHLSEGAWNRLDKIAQKSAKVGDVVNAKLHDTSMKIPGGGLLSTPTDLVRFGQALMSNKLLSAESFKLMTTEMKTASGEGTGYGMGIGLDKKSEGSIISHSGGQAGTSTMMLIDQKSGTVVAVMANADGMPVGALARKILDAVASTDLVEGEPERIKVAHILVAFQGAARSTATRTKEEAEALANDLLERARKGEDFDKMMKEFSNDPGAGVYGLLNDGQKPVPEFYGRRQMVPAFGNVGFTLRVGEIGLAPHHAAESPFGWHVIKRIE